MRNNKMANMFLACCMAIIASHSIEAFRGRYMDYETPDIEHGYGGYGGHHGYHYGESPDYPDYDHEYGHYGHYGHSRQGYGYGRRYNSYQGGRVNLHYPSRRMHRMPRHFHRYKRQAPPMPFPPGMRGISPFHNPLGMFGPFGGRFNSMRFNNPFSRRMNMGRGRNTRQQGTNRMRGSRQFTTTTARQNTNPNINRMNQLPKRKPPQGAPRFMNLMRPMQQNKELSTAEMMQVEPLSTVMPMMTPPEHVVDGSHQNHSTMKQSTDNQGAPSQGQVQLISPDGPMVIGDINQLLSASMMSSPNDATQQMFTLNDGLQGQNTMISSQNQQISILPLDQSYPDAMTGLQNQPVYPQAGVMPQQLESLNPDQLFLDSNPNVALNGVPPMMNTFKDSSFSDPLFGMGLQSQNVPLDMGMQSQNAPLDMGRQSQMGQFDMGMQSQMGQFDMGMQPQMNFADLGAQPPMGEMEMGPMGYVMGLQQQMAFADMEMPQQNNQVDIGMRPTQMGPGDLGMQAQFNQADMGMPPMGSSNPVMQPQMNQMDLGMHPASHGASDPNAQYPPSAGVTNNGAQNPQTQGGQNIGAQNPTTTGGQSNQALGFQSGHNMPDATLGRQTPDMGMPPNNMNSAPGAM